MIVIYNQLRQLTFSVMQVIQFWYFISYWWWLKMAIIFIILYMQSIWW